VSGKKDRITKRRLRGAYFTSVLSMTLLLFLVGFVCLLILNTRKLSDYVKENIGFTIILNDDARDADVLRLQKNLDATSYVKSTRYITKDEASKELQKELGEDFVDFLGYNPLLNSIEVKFYADYANNDSLTWIEQELKEYPQIKEVYYQKNLLHLVNENISRISLLILGIAAMLIIISVSLLNHTIRLMIYARRMIIRTMGLVGATRTFIRTPFIINNIIQGVVASLIAFGFLAWLISYTQTEFGALITLRDFNTIAVLFLIILTFSILLTSLSTYFAVNRYLRMKSYEISL
jgi:cell division transport system permease protein